MPPSSDEQIQFLLRIQRLLGEGLFSATYKFALLLALADLSVEFGDDSGAPLELEAEKIAEKFIEYYWRQTLPFLGGKTLRQNAGKAPVVVHLLLETRSKYGDSLSGAHRDPDVWRNIVGKVADNVRAMPMRYLQNVGRDCLPFLYDPPKAKAPRKIILYRGVAFCFRRFHGLVTELVHAAWTKWVRQQNLTLIGESADLHEFLFGARRGALLSLKSPLQELQKNLCFYCQKSLTDQLDVDHFVPWALYPLDLGHNFVAVHRGCNSAKRDRLASEEHLAAWVARNQCFGERLATEFDQLGVLHDLKSTTRIAHWAYSTASFSAGLTWHDKETLVPLRGAWSSLLA